MDQPQIDSLEQPKLQPKCIKKRVAMFACATQSCTKPAFLCLDINCQCQLAHKKCTASKIDNLVKMIQSRVFSYDAVIKMLGRNIHLLHKKLEEIEIAIIQECKKMENQYTGLNQDEKNFMKIVKQGLIKPIDGHTISAIKINTKQNKEKQRKLNQITQFIQTSIKQFSIKIDNFTTLVKNRLNMLDQHLFQGSQVLDKVEQISQIEKFFLEQKQIVKSTKLIFRGTEHKFKASMFREMCYQEANTLVLCQNTFGKKLGGYMPQPWAQCSGHYRSQKNLSSFIFSLTNNDKFTIQSGRTLFWACPKDGPSFGRQDFRISDECHMNQTSSCLLNKMYVNEKYNEGQYQEAMTKMTGSLVGHRFRVKEYEVWRVKFAE